MAKKDGRQHQLTGVSGVHFVAARLSHLGYHAVPTTRNVQGPDLLVSTLNGSRSVAVQVKSTNWALRWRGRGKERKPHHCEWDIGWASAKECHDGLLFALVDLKNWEEMPDVYIVPSRVIAKYFSRGPEGWPRARYHETIELLEPFRNAWGVLEKSLK